MNDDRNNDEQQMQDLNITYSDQESGGSPSSPSINAPPVTAQLPEPSHPIEIDHRRVQIQDLNVTYVGEESGGSPSTSSINAPAARTVSPDLPPPLPFEYFVGHESINLPNVPIQPPLLNRFEGDRIPHLEGPFLMPEKEIRGKKCTRGRAGSSSAPPKKRISGGKRLTDPSSPGDSVKGKILGGPSFKALSGPGSLNKTRRGRKKATGDPGESSSAQTKEKQDVDPPKTLYTCYVCGKQFDRLKALHGHYRCHPERKWRGSYPPPTITEEEKEELANLLLRNAMEAQRNMEAGEKQPADFDLNEPYEEEDSSTSDADEEPLPDLNLPPSSPPS